MAIDDLLADTRPVPGSVRLRRALQELPRGGAERRAVEAGEVDAVIDYRGANVIMFPLARRALRAAANRACAASRKTTLEMPRANAVLAALPREEYLRLLPALELVTLGVGAVLQEPGAPILHVYFPLDCVVCLLTPTDAGRTVGTGLVGHEGIVGVSLGLGVEVASVRAVVQTAGAAMRMSAAQFGSDFRQSLRLQQELYRCASVKLAQARQNAACIASHFFEQRLACWLLTASDRSRSQDMPLTHEYLAAILNVRRVSVTKACTSLRSSGLITNVRGTIGILDRAGLEAASCACYRNASQTAQASKQ